MTTWHKPEITAEDANLAVELLLDILQSSKYCTASRMRWGDVLRKLLRTLRKIITITVPWRPLCKALDACNLAPEHIYTGERQMPICQRNKFAELLLDSLLVCSSPIRIILVSGLCIQPAGHFNRRSTGKSCSFITPRNVLLNHQHSTSRPCKAVSVAIAVTAQEQALLASSVRDPGRHQLLIGQ